MHEGTGGQQQTQVKRPIECRSNVARNQASESQPQAGSQVHTTSGACASRLNDQQECCPLITALTDRLFLGPPWPQSFRVSLEVKACSLVHQRVKACGARTYGCFDGCVHLDFDACSTKSTAAGQARPSADVPGCRRRSHVGSC